ncbi:hypothetical protein GCM10029978_065580 [Actinoallomurus acanthiterrae]
MSGVWCVVGSGAQPVRVLRDLAACGRPVMIEFEERRFFWRWPNLGDRVTERGVGSVVVEYAGA